MLNINDSNGDFNKFNDWFLNSLDFLEKPKSIIYGVLRFAVIKL